FESGAQTSPPRPRSSKRSSTTWCVPASRILGCSPPTNSHFLSGEVELTSTVKLLLVPSGVNLRIERLTWSATKRLPAPSKAKSPLTPDANALFVPSGLNLITYCRDRLTQRDCPNSQRPC